MATSPYSTTYDYAGATQNANNVFDQARATTQQRQNELSNYRGTMQDPAQMYSNYLGQAQNMYGFDPKQLLKSQQNLSNTQTTLANLPQAAQQQGGYYGATAGSIANNYAQQAGNLQAVLSGQGNAVNAYKDVLGATQNQANQQSQLGFQGQQLNVQALTSILQNALGMQTEQGNQVGRAQEQQAGYGAYLNAQQQAQAAMLGAQAQQTTAGATANYNNQQANQIAYNMDLQRQYAAKQQQASKPVVKTSPSKPSNSGPQTPVNNSLFKGTFGVR